VSAVEKAEAEGPRDALGHSLVSVDLLQGVRTVRQNPQADFNLTMRRVIRGQALAAAAGIQKLPFPESVNRSLPPEADMARIYLVSGMMSADNADQPITPAERTQQVVDILKSSMWTQAIPHDPTLKERSARCNIMIDRYTKLRGETTQPQAKNPPVDLILLKRVRAIRSGASTEFDLIALRRERARLTALASGIQSLPPPSSLRKVLGDNLKAYHGAGLKWTNGGIVKNIQKAMHKGQMKPTEAMGAIADVRMGLAYAAMHSVVGGALAAPVPDNGTLFDAKAAQQRAMVLGQRYANLTEKKISAASLFN